LISSSVHQRPRRAGKNELATGSVYAALATISWLDRKYQNCPPVHLLRSSNWEPHSLELVLISMTQFILSEFQTGRYWTHQNETKQQNLRDTVTLMSETAAGTAVSIIKEAFCPRWPNSSGSPNTVTMGGSDICTANGDPKMECQQHLASVSD